MSNTETNRDSDRRIAILASGRLDAFTAKTAAGVIRYRHDEVVGVIDPDHAGQDLATLIGVGKGIPIVASLGELATHRPDMLLIGDLSAKRLASHFLILSASLYFLDKHK